MTDDHSKPDHSKDEHSPYEHRTDYRGADDLSLGDQGSQPSHRPWRQLAEAVLRETDHEKILELAQELCDAVDEQVLGHRKKTSDD
jgi:hypothetical protein